MAFLPIQTRTAAPLVETLPGLVARFGRLLLRPAPGRAQKSPEDLLAAQARRAEARAAVDRLLHRSR